MGDIADYLMEEGEKAWIMHISGLCDGPCPYCEKEDQKEKAAAKEKENDDLRDNY